MNRKYSADLARLNFSLFFVSILVIGLLFFLLPKPTKSEYEKRDLAEFPSFTFESFFSGKYNKDLETYYSDVFPLREHMVRFSATLEDLRGVRGEDDIKFYD